MKKKKILIPAVIILIAAIVLPCVFYRNGKDAIDRTVEKYAPTGASVAIIENGKIKEIRNYGYANKETGQPVTEKTRFKIASISKTVTAYAVMQLVEEGRLNLDVPVNRYLTRWKIPESEYGSDRVTLRTLLSHTAGITGSDEWGYADPLPSIDEALKERDIRLKREPGTVFEYSEFAGYGICQLVIEEVTGEKFEDYMIKHVFEANGMMHTDYANASNEKGELAVPYAGGGKVSEVVPIVMNGAGGVTITSEDLAQFAIRLMEYYHTGNGEMFKVQDNTKSSGGVYGLGIIPRQLSDGREVYEHNGTLTGWNAQLVLEPESGNGIAVVSNSDKAYYMTYALMEAWSREALGEPVKDLLMDKIKKQVLAVAGVMAFMVLFAAIRLVWKIRKKQLIFERNRIKILVSAAVLVLGISADMIVFYTNLPFYILTGIKNYYLFTFFPPNMIYVQAEVLLLLLFLLIRINMKKEDIVTDA